MSVVKPIVVKALSAKRWIVSSSGTFVKSAVKSYETRKSFSSIWRCWISSANWKTSEIVYWFIDRVSMWLEGNCKFQLPIGSVSAQDVPYVSCGGRTIGLVEIPSGKRSQLFLVEGFCELLIRDASLSQKADGNT